MVTNKQFTPLLGSRLFVHGFNLHANVSCELYILDKIYLILFFITSFTPRFLLCIDFFLIISVYIYVFFKKSLMMIRVIALFKSYFFLKVCYYNVFFPLSFYSVHKDTNKILHREVGFLRIKPGTNQVAFISSHNNGMHKENTMKDI